MYRANNTLVHVQHNTIAVHNIATMSASMHITLINMIVFNTFNTYCDIKCIALDITY